MARLKDLNQDLSTELICFNSKLAALEIGQNGGPSKCTNFDASRISSAARHGRTTEHTRLVISTELLELATGHIQSSRTGNWTLAL
jgi:hypothetical protein